MEKEKNTFKPLKTPLEVPSFDTDSQILVKESKQTKPPKINDFKSMTLSILICIMISIFDFGSAFIYDLPQTLQKPLCSELEICESSSNYFYSAYAFPNMFVCLLGGYLIHRLGHKICVVIYSFFVMSGSITFTLGALYFKSFPVMMAGRVIQGVGAENLMIT